PAVAGRGLGRPRHRRDQGRGRHLRAWEPPPPGGLTILPLGACALRPPPAARPLVPRASPNWDSAMSIILFATARWGACAQGASSAAPGPAAAAAGAGGGPGPRPSRHPRARAVLHGLAPHAGTRLLFVALSMADLVLTWWLVSRPAHHRGQPAGPL